MTELTPIKKIDTVLAFFATNKVAELYMPYEVIITYCLNEDGSKFENNELVMILNKLQKDGYILHDKGTHPSTQKDRHLYYITFEGKVFYQQGGYGQQLINSASESIRAEIAEKTQKGNQLVLIWLTVILAVGALIAAWYYLTELWKFYCHT